MCTCAVPVCALMGATYVCPKTVFSEREDCKKCFEINLARFKLKSIFVNSFAKHAFKKNIAEILFTCNNQGFDQGIKLIKILLVQLMFLICVY